MATLPGRLGELRARDVMTRKVILLHDTDTLAAALETLKASHITGAPVVDGDGKLVGILSLNDLIDWPEDVHGTGPWPSPLSHDPDRAAWHLFDRAALSQDEHQGVTVAERMSTAVRSVAKEASLVDVARAMCDGHWHRVPVVDSSGR